MENPPPKPSTGPKEWHPQQAKLLKEWAEIASSYRWMHNQAYMIYKRKNLHFMLPLIIMSTVTGTANFAQSTFPEMIRSYVPQIIGAINLVSAIMTTIYQFLKISEFMESHRISSINYGKLARTITVELNLPVKDRNSGGAECVKTSRTEIDRLIEQSPAIPKHVLYNYEAKFAGKGLSEPEIVVINRVNVYEDRENKVSTTIAEAGLKLKNALLKTKKPLFNFNESNRKESINKELNELRTSNLVSSINTNVGTNIISTVLQKMRLSPKKQPVITPPSLPSFTECYEIPESISKHSPSGSPKISVPDEEMGDVKIINDTVDELVDEIVPRNDVEMLKQKKLVSSFKARQDM